MAFEATHEDIGPGTFWRALGARPVGATVATAIGVNGPAGFLCLSFSHVSAVPPKVIISVSPQTSALQAVRDSKCFAVNQLPAGAEAVAKSFGGETAAEQRFSKIEWSRFVTGAPVFRDAAVAFDCEVAREIQEDGAVLFIGRVVGLRSPEFGTATLAFQGGFRSTTSE